MNKFRFKCSNETVKNIYSLFDTLVKNDKVLSRMMNTNEDITITKGFYGNCGFSILGERFDLDESTLEDISAKGLFEGNEDYTSIFMLKELNINNGYFFKQDDIVRCSEDYGIVGDRKEYSNKDIIFAPKSLYDFREISEVREEYKDLIPSRYRKAPLPNDFKNLCNTKSYRLFSKEQIDQGYTVNSLFERDGSVFCRNRVRGYKALDYLEGLEYDFYNELLRLVVSLGKPVHRVYFYSDLNWSCILYRESREVKGEFDIVLK